MRLPLGIRKGMMGLAGVLAFVGTQAHALVTLEASNGVDSPFSYSWLHSATGAAHGGFYMNGDAERFTPFSFSGDWDGSVLSVTGSTMGSIGNALVGDPGDADGDVGSTGINENDKFEFTGGKLKQLTDNVTQGFLKYKITRVDTVTVSETVIDEGFFFVWGKIFTSSGADSPNSLLSTGAAGDEMLTLTIWANNWVNGLNRDWTFLHDLDPKFFVDMTGATTDVVQYDGANVALTTDGELPEGIGLGIDLRAGGMNSTTIVPVPIPAAGWAGLSVLSGLGVLRYCRRVRA